MNEQIKQLAEQAGFENGHQDRYGNSLSQELEKFAELIVRECIKQVFYTIEDEEEDNISSSIRDRIKQHFGVEE